MPCIALQQHTSARTISAHQHTGVNQSDISNAMETLPLCQQKVAPSYVLRVIVINPNYLLKDTKGTTAQAAEITPHIIN